MTTLILSPIAEVSIGITVLLVSLAIGVCFVALSAKDRNASPKLPGGKPDGWRRTPNSMVPFEPIYDEPPAQPALDEQVAHCDRVGNDGWHGWQKIRKDLKTDM